MLACSSLLARRVALTRAHAVGAQWEFTTGEALPGAAWEVTYVVDAAEHQRELPLGRTPRTDYAAGACAAEFACDTIDVAGVPLGYVRCTAFTTLVADTCPCSWLNNIGLLKLVLRDADDAEVHVSSLLTQIVRAELLHARVACSGIAAVDWLKAARGRQGCAALTPRFVTQTKSSDGFMRRFVSPL